MSVAVPEEAGLDVTEATVRFGGLVALDSVSVDIRHREIVGIIGPNGAGKTTLFNAICGFVRPEAGRISYRARSLAGIRPYQLARRGIGRTLQSLGLWRGLTVLENVMAGGHVLSRTGFLSSLAGLPRADADEDALRRRAADVLDELDIASAADRHPSELPYGIQKRVVLARALIAEPSLLLLDEPASGLSETEMSELADLLRRLRERMAVALVEHHMDLVMTVCDRVHVLDFGRKIASGTPDAVKSNPLVTTAYLGEEVRDA